MHLQLDNPEPALIKEDGELITGSKVKACLDEVQQRQYQEKVEQEKWQGKLMKNRWDDNNLDLEGRFAWLHHWKTAPTHTVAGLQELYQQLLPTKVYHHRKTGMSGNADERCHVYGKTSESVGDILAGCSAIAQTQYLARHNNAFKILFFEMLRSLNLISTTAPWYSQAQPKPMYENDRVVAYWDVPLFADTTHIKANRIDARIVDKERKEVKLLEMSCQWVENREEKARPRPASTDHSGGNCSKDILTIK